MQALISLHHLQYLERAAKSTEVWKILWGWVKVRNVWPSAGSLGPGFYNWSLRSQNRALQLGLTGLSWALNVMLRKITSNKIISWWKVLEMRGNLRAPDLEAHKERALSKGKPSGMKHWPSKEPWSSQRAHLSPSTGKTKAGEMKHPSQGHMMAMREEGWELVSWTHTWLARCILMT